MEPSGLEPLTPCMPCRHLFASGQLCCNDSVDLLQFMMRQDMRQLGAAAAIPGEAAGLGWKLPASETQLLVGAKPRGTSFSRYGLSFRPAGKHGQ
jgi:hypothetical protein